MVAARTGCAEMVRFLISQGADLFKIQSSYSRNILHFAAASGSTGLLEYLLDPSMNLQDHVTATDSSNLSVLHYAATSGIYEPLQYLLETNKSICDKLRLMINDVDNLQRTPLHFACEFGNLQGVEFLLSLKADQNAVCRIGNTPLLYAAHPSSAYWEIVSYLLHSDQVDATYNNNVGESLLHLLAVWFRERTLLKQLLRDRKLDLNTTTSSGCTPLHFAAESGNLEAFTLFLELGSDPSLLSKTGESLMHKVARSGNVEMAKVLLSRQEYQQTVHARMFDEQTPLHLAASALNLSMVEFLLKRGADINAADTHGYTILHCACKSDVDFARVELRLQLVRLLLGSPGGAWRSLYRRANVARISQCRSGRGMVPYEVVTQETPFELAASHDVRQVLSEYDPTIIAKEFLIPFEDVEQFCRDEFKVQAKPGAHSHVFRGTLHGTSVAVKQLIFQATSQIELQFLSEVGIMGQLHHPNICLLMAACLEPPNLCLVMEYCPATLHGAIGELTFPQRVKISMDICRGMLWLHTRKMPILHCDLKPANILLNENYSLAKVTDFGISLLKPLVHKDTNNRNRTYTKIFAPETKETGATIQSDIYAFGLCGVLLYNKIPELTLSTTPTTEEYALYWKQYIFALPEESEFTKIIRKCCEIDVNVRYSSFKDVLESFEQMEKTCDFEKEILIQDQHIASQKQLHIPSNDSPPPDSSGYV